VAPPLLPSTRWGEDRPDDPGERHGRGKGVSREMWEGAICSTTGGCRRRRRGGPRVGRRWGCGWGRVRRLSSHGRR
jgi:hypothetical protein